MKSGYIPRLDRLVSLGLAYPLRLFKLGARPRIPILMYHSISDTRGTKHPYFETNTSSRLFSEQMKFLKENGYQTMDLAGALIGLEANKQEYKQVVVTFDDAYRDFYTDASPILAKYGFSATVFVVTGLTGSGRARTGALEYMTWSEVREVYSHGIRIGSHTVSHPELQALSSEQVDAEVRKSKEVLENELGASVQSFSYPYAFPEQDQHFIHLLKTRLRNCGYENGVSTMIGTATSENDPFFLPRLPINCYDDLRFFRAKLEGAYDWLHAPQKFYKSFCKMGSSPTRELLHANQN